MYAIIDCETTGTRPGRNRIIEIAILLHDGHQVTDSFSTLIHPEGPIPHFITGMTGITNAMVEDAPKFYQVAKRIVEMTQGRTFVAHNVHFDYGMVRGEFAALGYPFRCKRLCTVRLARRLVPGLASYSLGRLCEQLQIPVQDRHRALGDAQATARLFEHLTHLENGPEHLSKQIIQDEVKQGLLPPKLTAAHIEPLPEATGVYRFFDEHGHAVYVGKSQNIRGRVLTHINSDLGSGKSIAFKNSIADLSFDITGSDLIARLLEASEIKRLRPQLNRAQRRLHFPLALVLEKDPKGYLTLEVRDAAAADAGEARALTQLSSHLAGRRLLEKLHARYELCNHLLSLYAGSHLYDLDDSSCRGACRGLETPELYNRRVLQLARSYELPHSDFLILDDGRNVREQSVVLIEAGQCRGYSYFGIDHQFSTPTDLREGLTFQHLSCSPHEAKQIVLTFLKRKPHTAKIVPF